MTVKGGATWAGLIVTKDATGALTAPTVGPTGALYVNGAANAAAVAIAGANPYSWSVVLPALAAGDCVSMYITATIATIATASVVAEDVADTAYGSEALRPTTAGRTLDVSEGGAAGVDWANVEGQTTTVVLSGTTVKTATDVETDTADIQSKIGTPSNLGSGASVAANLVDIEGQTDDIGAAGAGLTAVPVATWTYATRTLTSTAAATVAAVSGSTLAITARATYQETITGLMISASWEKIWFTLKSDVSDADASSVVQILETNPGAVTDGLIYLNGAAGTAGQGSLTVNQSAGTIDIVIADEATDDLTPAGGLVYDIKQLVAGVTTVLTNGAASIAYTATAAIA